MRAESSPGTFAMSGPLSIADQERLYHDVVLKRDFYGDSYGAEWIPAPYDDMAVLLSETISPTKHVDVGCGKGFLVSAMRRRGIVSFGIDFSSALIQQAPPDIQRYLEVASIENWIQSGAFQDADLITYMEVFEHLPLRVAQGVLETLRDSFRGRLLVTTPSYGIDERWTLGILTNPGTSTWQEDMLRNRPFRQIVLHDGVPHHGHITLCSYRWWTEFFLSNGWVRSLDLERRISKKFGLVLKKYRWNPYLLDRLISDLVEIDPSSSNQLGAGWHDAETAGTNNPGRWTNGRAEIYISSTQRKWSAVEIVFSAPDINVVRDYTLAVVIEQQVRTDQYELRWEPVFASTPVAIAARNKVETVEIKVKWPALVAERSNESAVFRLTLLSPSFCPSDYGLSRDTRILGLFLRKILIKTAL